MTSPTPRILPPRRARQAIRTPGAAAIAGIVFAILTAASLVMMHTVIQGSPATSWVTDDSRRSTLLLALNLTPFAGIAFLWFIGVVRDRLGADEDRFFATVFLGSGLIFVGLQFVGSALASALIVAKANGIADNDDLWTFGKEATNRILSNYSMRMAAVFTMSTSTLSMRLRIGPRWLVFAGFGTAAVLLLFADAAPWLDLLFPAWVFALSLNLLIATLRQRHAEETRPMMVSSRQS